MPPTRWRRASAGGFLGIHLVSTGLFFRRHELIIICAGFLDRVARVAGEYAEGKCWGGTELHISRWRGAELLTLEGQKNGDHQHTHEKADGSPDHWLSSA